MRPVSWPPVVIATAVPHPLPLVVQAAAVYEATPEPPEFVKLTVSDPLVVLVPPVIEVMVGESTWLVSAWGPTWVDEAR